MTLYVGLFRGDTELEGWVLGHYSDFGFFRDVVRKHFTQADLPLLLGSSDCDAEFKPHVLPALRDELDRVAARFRDLPPIRPVKAFEHTQRLWSAARSLFDCFHNVDGENLLQALIRLCERGVALDGPLLFQ